MKYWMQVLSTDDPDSRAGLLGAVRHYEGHLIDEARRAVLDARRYGQLDDCRVLIARAQEGKAAPLTLQDCYGHELSLSDLDMMDPASVGWDVRPVMGNGVLDPDRLARVGALRRNREGVLEEFQGRECGPGEAAGWYSTGEPVKRYGKWVAVEEVEP